MFKYYMNGTQTGKIKMCTLQSVIKIFIQSHIKTYKVISLSAVQKSQNGNKMKSE